MTVGLAGVDRRLAGPVEFCFQAYQHTSSTNKT